MWRNTFFFFLLNNYYYQKNAAHEFELASLHVSQEAFKGLATIALVEDSPHHTEVVLEVSHSTRITEIVHKVNQINDAFTSAEQTKYRKLNNSNCLNFICPSYRTHYKHTMSASDHSDIIERFNKLSDEFDSSLNEEDKMIDNLFAALEVFADK